MDKNKVLIEYTQTVQSHLGLIQSVIQRMAGNSVSCKTWCITLVSAILVIVVDKGKSSYALITLIPTLLFFVLDTYYLSLEKAYRDSYNLFIDKLHNNKIYTQDLFLISSPDNLWRYFSEAIRSLSVWPFYTTLFAMILIANRVL